ncbi:unnamed protein product [Caenorhabditis auriculariae]|uniref:Uncharacterized protein n=1 Tax=Caenorhabditis auriculariae TaxID=2777116 RepID=A0A8S1H297_9PELO|nr:unnamed protein product [Caenorhabditis auriculariae]
MFLGMTNLENVYHDCTRRGVGGAERQHIGVRGQNDNVVKPCGGGATTSSVVVVRHISGTASTATVRRKTSYDVMNV